MKAKPHCMKKMMMDMMSRKKWSISFGLEMPSCTIKVIIFISNYSTLEKLRKRK